MNLDINYLRVVFVTIGSVISWFLGVFDSLIYALIAFVAIDYITGILLAIQNKKISSKIGFKGIFKKFSIFLLVSVGNIIDKYILCSGSSLRTLLIMFYLSNEAISIIENVGMLGLPVPKKLKDIVQQLNNHDSK